MNSADSAGGRLATLRQLTDQARHILGRASAGETLTPDEVRPYLDALDQLMAELEGSELLTAEAEALGALAQHHRQLARHLQEALQAYETQRAHLRKGGSALEAYGAVVQGEGAWMLDDEG